MLFLTLFSIFQLTVAGIEMDGSFSLNFRETHTSDPKKLLINN